MSELSFIALLHYFQELKNLQIYSESKILFLDITKLLTYYRRRKKISKVFKKICRKNKIFMNWFFVFKRYIITNYLCINIIIKTTRVYVYIAF